MIAPAVVRFLSLFAGELKDRIACQQQTGALCELALYGRRLKVETG
jgi:hypothetical protein